jgi:hypothetical protein
LEIDPHPTVTATVSTEFTIQIWIRNIPEGYSIAGFDLRVTWEPTQMELVSHQEFTPPGKNWDKYPHPFPDHYDLGATSTGSSETTDLEMAWFSLTFHCLTEGSSKITVSTLKETVFLSDGTQIHETYPESFQITCNQVEPSPVGGLVMPTNKLEILTPYLALAGLIAAVSAVVVVKRRRD